MAYRVKNRIGDVVAITIYPPGTATTNYAALSALKKEFPEAVNLTQKILTRVSKLERKSIFQSKQRKLQEIQGLIYQLRRALNGFEGAGSIQSPELVRNFMSRFSYCAPNWQAEYRFLDRFIWDCLSGT
jgi:hypothetical protein